MKPAPRDFAFLAEASKRLQELHAGNVVWSKDTTGSPHMTAGELRESLARDFVVVSPDEFFGRIDEHKARMRNANSPLGIGSRETPLPFRFYPAVGAEALREIEDFDASVDASIREQIASRAIVNLPWFLDQVQWKVFTSLMLGHHDETGRALAVYAAVMDVVRKQMFAAPRDDREREARETLLDHHAMASYASPRLLGYGKADEFADASTTAQQTYDEWFASGTEAVESFFETSSF